MRVRIRRFDGSATAEARNAETVEVRSWQRGLKGTVCGHGPPAARMSSGRPRDAIRDSPGAQFTVDGRAMSPLFELHGPEAVTEPFVEVPEDARRLGQSEVELPAGEIAPQFRADHRHAPASVAAHVQVVRVAREHETPLLQLLVHFVQ